MPSFVLFIYEPGRTEPRTVPLSGRRLFTIGRGDENDVCIDELSVSRVHATLSVSPLRLVDMGSRNGTTVETGRLASRQSTALTVGRTFRIGDVKCRVDQLSPNAVLPVPPAANTTRVVHDPKMFQLYGLLDKIANSRLAVLVLGETGVGKEVYARAIHERSARAQESFLDLNCAALPEAILDYEIFGDERHAGIFEAANGGTVFLDEVGGLPLGTQAKLLRVLESSEVIRGGQHRAIKVNARFVAATKHSLQDMVASGTFRQDLYFRLNALTVAIPPLRERECEIVPLAETILARIAPERTLSDEARFALQTHVWPGNVRELKNALERAITASSDGPIEVADLALDEERPTKLVPRNIRSRMLPLGALGSIGETEALVPPSAATFNGVSGKNENLRDELRALERARIIDALARTAGNQTHAARILGMSRFVLMKRLSEYEIARPRKGPEV